MSKTVMGQTVSIGGNAASIERRRSPRRAVNHRGRLSGASFKPGDPAADVKIIDISDHGMAFIARAPFDPGASFQILVIRDEGFNFKANLEVVRCRPLEDGTYRIGAQII